MHLKDFLNLEIDRVKELYGMHDQLKDGII